MLLSSLALLSLTEDNPTFFSREDGTFEASGLWSNDGYDGEEISEHPACAMSGKSSVNIQDSVVSLCDKMILSGNAQLIVAKGGELHLKGGMELIGNAQVNVEEGGSLIIGGKLEMTGGAKLNLSGSLSVNGDIEVLGQAFACGNGNALVGGRIAGIGWCLDLNVLPIEMINIDANLRAEKILTLEWTSLIESEKDVFIVERSANGMSFEEIGRLEGTAEAGSSPQYTLKDEGLTPGHYYYRITQENRSGETEAVEMIAATIAPNEETGICELEVDPNPCVPGCTVTLTDCPGSAFRAYVVDGAGRMISELVPINTRDRDRTIQYYLNKNNFAMPGVYIIRAESDEVEVSKKLIIN
ncbi:MAG: hypothetical protein HQ500_01900 [Flavobacteriales bacterium]|nr:hypothetical protein [Flavobacteriales bacterium]